MHDIVTFDQQALLYLNGLGSTTFDQFWKLVSDKWIWIPLYVIFLYYVVKVFPKRSIIYILIFIALGVTASDQLASLFKNGIMRPRPCHEELVKPFMRWVECGGPYGFYSGHASNSFFLATFLSIMLKKSYQWFPYVIFIWAIVVSYSRIYLGVHYPGDVLVGAIMGILLGGFFATLAWKTINKKSV